MPPPCYEPNSRLSPDLGLAKCRNGRHAPGERLRTDQQVTGKQPQQQSPTVFVTPAWQDDWVTNDSDMVQAVVIPAALSKDPEGLVKSRQRVADHGEVFTPSWMVEDMLDLVKTESERIDSRFLEPACGSGNFLKSVLKRKLTTVQSRYGKSDFERRHHALFALMCIYGIELLKDNVQECRENLLAVFSEYLQVLPGDNWYHAAKTVLEVNILQGDALTLTASDGRPIEFPEWGYLGGGKFQRRDFRYDALTQRSSFEGTLFEVLEEHELFIPTKTHPQMTVEEISQ